MNVRSNRSRRKPLMKKHLPISRERIDSRRGETMAFFGIGYYAFDSGGQVLFMDQGAFNLFDLGHSFDSPENVEGRLLPDILEATVHQDLLARLKQHGSIRGFEWHFITHRGEDRWLFEDARVVEPVPGSPDAGDMLCIESVVRDITMRKHKESVYLSDQLKYQRILEAMREGYYEVDLRGRLTFFNRALSNILGEPEERLLGQNPAELYQDPGLLHEMRKAYERLRANDSDVLIEWPLMRRDGSRVVMEMSMSLMSDNEGRACGFRGLVRDVTDRVTAEAAYRNAETRYHVLLEEANDIIYTHDFEGQFTLLNKAGELVSGYTRDEAYQMKVFDIIAPEFREMARQNTQRRLQGEEIGRYELEIITKTGQRVPLEVNARVIIHDGQPLAVQGIARDITERRRAEEQRRRLEQQILHTQKLEGLGVLAGGIAHDFNNLLVGILGNASLAVRRLPRNSPLNDYMKRIEKAAQRAAELTNQMLAYSGRGTFIVRPLYLDRLAREIVDLARAGIPKKITFDFDFEEHLPPVLGDVAQMHQVLMNLISNAAEAIGDNVGLIQLGAHKVALDADYLAGVYFHAEAAPGNYLRLMVSDTGCGMTEAQKNRIFDPFFSTKFTGRGLGLAAHLGIVRGHKGAVNVYSEPGHGTMFNLYFPVIEKGAAPAPARATSSDSEEATLRKWRTEGVALLADDEEAVRVFAREVLQRLGMTVLAAHDGKDALALYNAHRDELRVALIDLMMPFVNGQEVLEHIRETRPELPVILSSGYTEAEILERFRENQPDHFIQKPYRALELVRVIKQVLDNESLIKS